MKKEVDYVGSALVILFLICCAYASVSILLEAKGLASNGKDYSKFSVFLGLVLILIIVAIIIMFIVHSTSTNKDENAELTDSTPHIG